MNSKTKEVLALTSVNEKSSRRLTTESETGKNRYPARLAKSAQEVGGVEAKGA